MSELDQVAANVIPTESQAVQSWAGLLYRPGGPVELRGDLTPDPDYPMPLKYRHGLGFWLATDRRNSEVAYQPLRMRGLHRRFARLGSGNLKTITTLAPQFATRYGFLGPPWEVPRLARIRGPLTEEIGESLQMWLEEAHECAAYVALWDLVRMRDQDAVSKYVLFPPGSPSRGEIFFAWRGGKLSTNRSFDADFRTTTYGSEGETVLGGWNPSEAYLWERLTSEGRKRPDVLDVARRYLGDRITAKLQGCVSPMLRSERPGGTAMFFCPHSLRAAIYLHFAREMTGQSGPASPCGNPGCTSTLPTNHRRRRYCSDDCRVEAWRARSRAAIDDKSA